MIILIVYAMHFYLNIISPFDCSKSGGVGPPHFEKWGGPDPPDPPGGYARVPTQKKLTCIPKIFR